jgi:hypothetical protein
MQCPQIQWAEDADAAEVLAVASRPRRVTVVGISCRNFGSLTID